MEKHGRLFSFSKGWFSGSMFFLAYTVLKHIYIYVSIRIYLFCFFAGILFLGSLPHVLSFSPEVAGLNTVQRVVCGGNLDFKVAEGFWVVQWCQVLKNPVANDNESALRIPIRLEDTQILYPQYIGYKDI